MILCASFIKIRKKAVTIKRKPRAVAFPRNPRATACNRLTSRTTSGTLNTPYGANFYWNLDAVGNRTSTSWGGTPSTYTLAPTQLNQYATASGSNQTYDTRGNLTSDGSLSLGYDADNRLKTAVKGGTTVNYTYDFAHRLAKRAVGVFATRYIYDQNWNVLADINGSTGATNVIYLHGPSVDDVVAEIRSAGTNINYLLKDHLGSTTAVVQPGTGVTQRYTYDEYGAVQVRDSAGNPTASAPSSRYLFTGRELDTTTGVYHYRHRWYHPGQGRFISPDPIGFEGGDFNIYGLVLNNPLLKTDPFGLKPEKLSDNQIGRKFPNLDFHRKVKPKILKCVKLPKGVANGDVAFDSADGKLYVIPNKGPQTPLPTNKTPADIISECTPKK